MSSKLPTHPFNPDELYQLVAAYWGDNSIDAGASELAIALMDSPTHIADIRQLLKRAIELSETGDRSCGDVLQRVGFSDVETSAQVTAELTSLLDAFERELAKLGVRTDIAEPAPG